MVQIEKESVELCARVDSLEVVDSKPIQQALAVSSREDV